MHCLVLEVVQLGQNANVLNKFRIDIGKPGPRATDLNGTRSPILD